MTITARFDGRVFVPDEPVDLPTGRRVQLQVEPTAAPTSTSRPTLLDLLSDLLCLPENRDWPADGAIEHDHYLYGTPKLP